MSKNSKYFSFFTQDQIRAMSTSDLYTQISRFKGTIEKIAAQGEDLYRYECELCYLENEVKRRERSKNRKQTR